MVNIDEVIHIIRSSKDPAEARERLVARDWPAGDMIPLVDLIADPRTVLIEGSRVRLTDEQARAILALTLSRLTGLGRGRRWIARGLRTRLRRQFAGGGEEQDNETHRTRTEKREGSSHGSQCSKTSREMVGGNFNRRKISGGRRSCPESGTGR